MVVTSLASKSSQPKADLGCLILHGFTSHIDCVTALVPWLEKEQIPYRLPILRGHGKEPKDLEGVTRFDWYEDAAKALNDLQNEASRVIIVALSMGSLIALELAAKRPEDITALALMAPALQVADPLSFLSPLIAKITAYWPVDARKAFTDQQRAEKCQNYKIAPTKTILSFLEYGKYTKKNLNLVKAPLLIMHSQKDRVIATKSSHLAFAGVSSKDKELIWFKDTGHEMLLDTEVPEVLAQLEKFITRFRLN